MCRGSGGRWGGAGASGWLAEDFFHRLALCQLVHEFVQVADLAHQGVFDVLDAHAADNALDQAGIGVGLWGLAEEGADVDLLLQLLFSGRRRCSRSAT